MIALFIVMAIFVALLTAFFFIKNKHERFILNNSISIEKIKTINRRYFFYDLDSIAESNRYDNKEYFNTISCEDYLIYQLQFKNNQGLFNFDESAKNRENYTKYLNEINGTICLGKYRTEPGKLNVKWLDNLERKKYNTYVIHPRLEINAVVTLYLTNLNGEFRDSKEQCFGEYQIKELIKRVNNKNGTFFNDRGIWDSICRVERGKVSNKMRFEIMRRDGYRCKMCGATNEFQELEIDHIYPISKGGKSTYDNLQTLCHSCNMKKGNRIM